MVSRLCAAVDANVLTLQQAALQPSTLIIVHHGLAWNGLCPMTGGKYRMMKNAIEADLAVYSSHLPLDAHPEYGNNILLTRLLDFSDSTPFLEIKGTLLSRLVETSMPREVLSEKVKTLLGTVQLIPGGPQTTSRILISTGSGNSLLPECAASGIDTLVTGEVSHDAFSQAHELGINLILGGHYATETLGVKALTEHLSTKFNLPWEFIDMPSGL
jgi:dinuclear metal center YbgI/SA1388 family protein